MLITQVVRELSSLGLNASTLQLLVSSSGGPTPLAQQTDKLAHLQYEFEGMLALGLLTNIRVRRRYTTFQAKNSSDSGR